VDASLRLKWWETRTEWPLAAIALAFLAAYSVQVLVQPDQRVKTAIESGITAAWAIFLVDYLVRLSLATDKLRWFFQHIIDLAIVALPFLRPLRLLRLLVLFGALQKAIGGAIRGRVIVYTGFSSVLLIYVASLAILDVERGQPGTRIINFGDAVWWSIATVTTVGYGDLSPVTTQGRVIAVLLMIGGISLVGVVTATIASWIIQRVAEEDTANQAVTAAQIEALRRDLESQLERLSTQLRVSDPRANDSCGEPPASQSQTVAQSSQPDH
jgi:voltage-gated potassium channel